MNAFTRRFGRVLPVVLACCLCPLVVQATDRSSSYHAALDSITVDRLQQHVDYLANDTLEGREAGKPGGRAAGDYLRQHLDDLGLRGAGIDGGFYQPFGSGYRNILAMLRGSDPDLKNQFVVVCAHYDHVGYGTRRNSRGPVGRIHNGADDNASGTSGLLELAEAFALLPQPPGRSILFAFWDAEEKGLLGSKHWVAHPTLPVEDVAAAVNMDMVGWLRRDQLSVLGTRSGYGLRRLVTRQNEGPALKLLFPWKMDPNSDHYPFFTRDTPILVLHTGMTEVHHTPRDVAELVNSEGMGRIIRMAFHLVHELASRPEIPRFRQAASHETESHRKRFESPAPKPASRLGVSWRPEDSAEYGVLLAGVASGSPADRADLRPGDRIVQFDGLEVTSGNGLRGAVMGAENPASLVVQRPGHEQPLNMSVQLTGKPLRLGITWRVDAAEPGTIFVSRVVAGSPAAKAGLRVGDRIYRIAGRDFGDDAQFARLANTLPGPLELLIERHGQLRTVVVRFKAELTSQAA